MPSLASGQYGGSAGMDIRFGGSVNALLMQCLFICGQKQDFSSPLDGFVGGDTIALWSLRAGPFAADGSDQMILRAGPYIPTDAEQLGQAPSTVLARLSLVPYLGGWHRLEVAWGTSQWSNPGGAGSYTANGFVEVKLDGVVVVSVTGEARIHARNYEAGTVSILPEDKWNSIRFAGGLAIDNIYLTDTPDYNDTTGYWFDDSETGVLLRNPIYTNDGFTNFFDPTLFGNTQFAGYVEGVGNPGRGITTPGDPGVVVGTEASGFGGFVMATWMFGGVPGTPYESRLAPKANGVERYARCLGATPAPPPPPTPNDRRLDVSWVAFDVPDDGDDDGDGDPEEFPLEGCPDPNPAPSVPDDCEGSGPLQQD